MESVSSFLWRIMRKHLFSFLAMMFMVIAIPFIFYFPIMDQYSLYLKLFYNYAPPLAIVVSFLFWSFIMEAANYFTFLFASFFVPKITDQLKNEAFEEVRKNSIQFFHKHPEGEIEKNVSSLGESFSVIMDMTVSILIPTFLPVFILLIKAYQNGPYFLGAAILWLAVVFGIISWASKIINESSRELIAVRAEQSGYATDSIKNILVEKVFRNEKEVLENYQKRQEKDSNLYRSILRRHGFHQGFMGYISICFMFGPWLILLSNLSTLGPVKAVAMLNCTFSILDKLWGFNTKVFPVIQFWGRFRKSYEFIFNLKEEEHLGTEDVPHQNTENTLEVKNLSYFAHSKQIFKNVNYKFQKGLYILDGASGEGKTTLLYMIAGLIPTVKNIFYREKDVCNIKREKLLDNVSFVTQSNLLYNDSIKRNIMVGRKVSDEKFLEVCKKTGVHEFAISLPKQYETCVGVSGCNLSGGQIQRICIARAMLCDKEDNLIIFDEPSSALDNESANIIVNLLENLSKERTILCVDHSKRLHHIANVVLTLKDGELTEKINFRSRDNVVEVTI